MFHLIIKHAFQNYYRSQSKYKIILQRENYLKYYLSHTLLLSMSIISYLSDAVMNIVHDL